MRIARSGRLEGSLLVAIVGIAISCGCSDDNNNVLSPKFQPEITNSVDNFQFQATGVTGVTQTLDYAWRNTGTQANVDQSCAITAGTATLVLRDSTGTQVYTRNLAENGSFASTIGLAGNWNVHVTLVQVSGTLNFRVQKKT